MQHNLSLFENPDVERLPIIDAEAWLYRQVELGRPPDQLLTKLIDGTEWHQPKLTIYGKTYSQPRLSAWYSADGLTYSWSGASIVPQGWTPTLLNMKARVESLLDRNFNSLLLNYYRDHRDGMGMHSDDEPELGPRPLIASLSLGEERTLVLKHKYRKDLKPLKLPLPSGSLLVMGGDMQGHWKHGIMKQKQVFGPRLNLTFRNIVARPEAASA